VALLHRNHTRAFDSTIARRGVTARARDEWRHEVDGHWLPISILHATNLPDICWLSDCVSSTCKQFKSKSLPTAYYSFNEGTGRSEAEIVLLPNTRDNLSCKPRMQQLLGASVFWQTACLFTANGIDDADVGIRCFDCRLLPIRFHHERYS
jgi:hypothetical protein